MTLNALNGSKTEVACVRIKQFKIVKPTQFRVEPNLQKAFAFKKKKKIATPQAIVNSRSTCINWFYFL